MKDKRQRMTVAWPYGLTDPGVYAYLMTAAAHANMNGYPYPALQSAMQSVTSPFNPYYTTGVMTPASRPSPYPTYNQGPAAGRDNLFQKPSSSLLDTMSSLSQASLLQQTIAKNNHMHNNLAPSHLTTGSGLMTTVSPQTSTPNVLLGSLFQPFKE